MSCMYIVAWQQSINSVCKSEVPFTLTQMANTWQQGICTCLLITLQSHTESTLCCSAAVYKDRHYYMHRHYDKALHRPRLHMPANLLYNTLLLWRHVPLMAAECVCECLAWCTCCTQLTYLFKHSSVKLLPIHRVFLNLPVASVNNVAVLTAQDQATAVWNGMCHPHSLNSANAKQQ